jgi:hypothetical protein
MQWQAVIMAAGWHAQHGTSWYCGGPVAVQPVPLFHMCDIFRMCDGSVGAAVLELLCGMTHHRNTREAQYVLYLVVVCCFKAQPAIP